MSPPEAFLKQSWFSELVWKRSGLDFGAPRPRFWSARGSYEEVFFHDCSKKKSMTAQKHFSMTAQKKMSMTAQFVAMTAQKQFSMTAKKKIVHDGSKTISHDSSKKLFHDS